MFKCKYVIIYNEKRISQKYENLGLTGLANL